MKKVKIVKQNVRMKYKRQETNCDLRKQRVKWRVNWRVKWRVKWRVNRRVNWRVNWRA